MICSVCRKKLPTPADRQEMKVGLDVCLCEHNWLDHTTYRPPEVVEDAITDSKGEVSSPPTALLGGPLDERFLKVEPQSRWLLVHWKPGATSIGWLTNDDEAAPTELPPGWPEPDHGIALYRRVFKPQHVDDETSTFVFVRDVLMPGAAFDRDAMTGPASEYDPGVERDFTAIVKIIDGDDSTAVKAASAAAQHEQTEWGQRCPKKVAAFVWRSGYELYEVRGTGWYVRFTHSIRLYTLEESTTLPGDWGNETKEAE